MTDEILLVLIPSRGRPDAAADLYEEWLATTDGNARLLLCLDADDPTIDRYPPGVPQSVGPRNGFAPRLSEEAVEWAPAVFALASWGDDHRPRTPGWDTAFLEELERLGTGFVYGNDLHAGETLPTACAMTSDVVTTLGYMTPPGMAHLYVDNVWLELGHAIDRITYLEDVVVEHMHPAAGKGEWDDLVRDANSHDAYLADRRVFDRWRIDQLPGAAEMLRGLL